MQPLFFTLAVSSLFAFWPFSRPPLSFYDTSTKSMLASLSIEEKVGQVFIAPLVATQIDQETRAFLKRSKLGNIVLYKKTNDLKRSAQIRKLTLGIYRSVMDHVRIPPLIAVDEEGGYVHHLQPATHFPSARAMGASRDTSLTRQAYRAMGLEARSLGLNLILAPVVDLHTERKSTLLATRSFSEDPYETAAFGQAALEGLKEAQMLSCLKHAPGHGVTAKDTHTTKALCRLPLKELEASHWIPFKQLSPNAPALMSAHVTYQAIDPELPATLSPTLLHELIRARWNFRGVIFSDSLTMSALSRKTKSQTSAGTQLGRLAVSAFKAGCDCCIIGPLSNERGELFQASIAYPMIEEAMRVFIDAVASGEISEEELNTSVERILTMKEHLPIEPPPTFDANAHLALSQTIAEKSITLLSSSSLFDKIDTSLFGKRITLLVPQSLESGLEKILSALQFLLNVEEVQVHVIGSSEDIAKEVAEILDHTADADLIFFLSRDIPTLPAQAKIATTLAADLPPSKLIFVGLGNPWELADLALHKTHLVYLTYSKAPSSLIALAKSLSHHLMPQGSLFPLSEKKGECENGVPLTQESL